MKFPLLLLVPLFLVACTAPKTPEKAPPSVAETPPKREKWLTYNERLAAEVKALRKQHGVSKITTFSPGLKDGKLMEYRSSIEEFDQDGNLIHQADFDEAGNTTKLIKNSFKNDRLRESEVIDYGGKSYYALYEYDADGLRLRETLYKKTDGDTLLARLYRYDSVGNEVEARMLNPDRRLDLRKTTSYDADGRPVEVVELNGDSANWKETYSYAGSEWTTRRVAGSGKVLSIFKSKFNEAEQATSIENLAEDGSMRLAIFYTYDDAGRLLVEDYRDKAGASQQRYQYAYDPQGIWVEKKTTSPRVQEPRITRREVAYRK